MDQWWRHWHRTVHRWIEKGNMNRMDHKEIYAKALRCRGLQWWRWRQLQWKEVERDKCSGPHPQRFKIYRWEDTVAGEVSKFTGNADGLSESVQENTGWLHLAQNLGSWIQFSKCGKSKEKMIPSASGTHVRPAYSDECWCYLFVKIKKSEMVQNWLWLAGFVWQWVWTSTSFR